METMLFWTVGLQFSLRHSQLKGFPGGSAGDTGLIPGSGRLSGEGNGNPLQYSCLGNLMDRGACHATVHGVAKESDVTWHLNNSSQWKPLALVGNLGTVSGEVGSLTQSLWVISSRYQLCTTVGV